MAANVNVDFIIMGGSKTTSNRNLNIPFKYISSNLITANTSTAANCTSPATWSTNENQTTGHAIITVNGATVRVTWNGTASNSTYGALMLSGSVLPVEMNANTKIHATEVTF